MASWFIRFRQFETLFHKTFDFIFMKKNKYMLLTLNWHVCNSTFAPRPDCGDLWICSFGPTLSPFIVLPLTCSGSEPEWTGVSPLCLPTFKPIYRLQSGKFWHWSHTSKHEFPGRRSLTSRYIRMLNLNLCFHNLTSVGSRSKAKTLSRDIAAYFDCSSVMMCVIAH